MIEDTSEQSHEPLIRIQLLLSQMAVAHSDDRPVSREITMATLELSVVGAPIWWAK
jgi:hypothetical protein